VEFFHPIDLASLMMRPLFAVLMIAASFGASTSRFDRTVHIIWLWFFLVLHAPFFGDGRNTRVATSFLAMLGLALLATCFVDWLPGQGYIEQLLARIGGHEPLPDPKMASPSPNTVRIVRDFAALCIEVSIIFCDVETNTGIPLAYGVLIVAAGIYCCRLEKTSKTVKILGCWILVRFMGIISCAFSWTRIGLHCIIAVFS
jgi:hypothetical protein